MAQKERRKTEEFMASGNDGRRYRVLEFTEFTDTRVMGDAGPQWVKGLRDYCTSDGEAVNVLGNGQFEIVGTGVILTPDSD